MNSTLIYQCCITWFMWYCKCLCLVVSCMTVPISQSSVYSPATKRSRRTNFWILPEPVRGKSSTCTQTFGVFCGDIFARQWACSAALSSGPVLLMNAPITSPHFGSGRPTTATSATLACSNRQFSISAGKWFSPPRMIIYFMRPVTVT